MSDYYEFLGELLKLREQNFLVLEELNSHGDWKKQELFAALAEDLDELDEELAEAICQVCDEIKSEAEI